VAPPGPAGTVVNDFIAAFEKADLDAALALVRDDMVYDNVPLGAMTGRDEVKAFLEPFLAGASEIEFIVLRQAEHGDLVMNERLDRFKIDGRIVEVPVTGVWEVVDGKIALWRDYFDAPTFANQVNPPESS
jgi:limonene-1,2-epoxide hydrolase